MAQSHTIELGTKAETLERLSPVLTSAIVLPALYFDVEKWERESAVLVEEIRVFAMGRAVIVRSSALHEDNAESSNAGAFMSVLNVESRSPAAVGSAVNAVVNSYGDGNRKHQVLVQPQLTEVAACGVIFTCDVQTGAPYYVISWDSTGATDQVTSGAGEQSDTHYVLRGATGLQNTRLVALIKLATEIEHLTGLDTLDLEFAFAAGDVLYLFQARPLVLKSRDIRRSAEEIRTIVVKAKAAIKRLNSPRKEIAGTQTVLSDMADWNPAELIGSHPRPLSLSLFQSLISDDVWRDARGDLGYVNPANEQLLVMLAGHPYVDTRNSFNSYLPQTIDPSVRAALVDEAVSFLASHPELHDKVEFHVALNCYTLDFPERAARLRQFGLTATQVEGVRSAFLEHTDAMISGGENVLATYVSGIKQMDRARAASLSATGPDDFPSCIGFLVADCKKRGTRAFAAIARLAFASNALLRSFVTQGIISERSYGAFFGSFPTMPGAMGQELLRVRQGKLSIETFLKKYGHLRPGTFDILSDRYDEAADFYFGSSSPTADTQPEERSHSLPWNAAELSLMQAALSNEGFSVTIERVLAFARLATIERENAKFLFTRNVSDSLKAIADWGSRHELSNDNLSFLDHQFIVGTRGWKPRDVVAQSRRLIAKRREHHARHEQVILPELIVPGANVEHVNSVLNRPNFVTQLRASGKPLVFPGGADCQSLQGRVVFIESADPGYDWIFLHSIAGLVTKYGGAGSHMGIRCQELNVPAAIGVGQKFDWLKAQPIIEMDCSNHTLRGGGK